MKSSGRSTVMLHSCLIFFHAQWLEKQPIFCVFHAEHGKAGESLCKTDFFNQFGGWGNNQQEQVLKVGMWALWALS